ARWFLERPGHLQFFPVHYTMLPVRCGGTLVQEVAAQLSLLEDIRPSARRPGLVRHLPFFIPLRFTKNHDVRGAGVVKRQIQARPIAAHDNVVTVDHLDTLDAADTSPVATRGWIFTTRIILVAP